MSDRLVTHSPLGSPDTLRAVLQLTKRFYNLHTPRQFGYSDVDALQYVGTSENFGSELFFETKKLKMLKPPSTFVNMSKPLISNFRVEAADYMESYLQSGMRMCTPKPGVLNLAYGYRIHFTDVSEVVIPRALHDGYGDGVDGDPPGDTSKEVYRTTFYVTTTPPTLNRYDGDLLITSEDLIAGSDGSAKYYFPKNEITERLITFTDTDAFITEDLKDYPELPWLFFTSDELITLPEVTMNHNVDRNGHELLTVGTNGQQSSFIYAAAYGETNLPTVDPLYEEADVGNWYILIYGAFIDCTNNHGAYVYNTGVHITRVEYVLLPDDANPAQGWEGIVPLASYSVEFDVDDHLIHICLLNEGNVYLENPYTFQKIREGVYGYDPNLLDQGYFTYVKFDHSYGIENPDMLNPIFRINFSEEFFFKREADLNHYVAGAHLDYTTDYSDHSIPKKFGVIHSLGDFDGLPKYFTYYLDRSIHRSHVELYAIRDDANNRNQKPMDKQTAAIIIDSAVPQNEIREITGLNVVLTYESKIEDGRLQPTYVTNEAAITSVNNYPTDIRFQSVELFLDDQICSEEERNECPRFIYHGNGYFSLGYIDYDPELEVSRVYLITNDGVAYINNEVSKNPKAERTAARICDIPTSFTQLLSVSGKSPTLLMDDKYIRMEAPVMLERPILVEDGEDEEVIISNDIDRLWNIIPSLRFAGLKGYTPKIYDLIVNINKNNELQKTPWCQLVDVRGIAGGFMWKLPGYQTFKVASSAITRVSSELDPIPDGFDCKYYLGNGGSGYAVDDVIGFNIGGVYLKVIVKAVTNGAITNYEFHMNNKYPGMQYDDGTLSDVIPDIPLSNFDGQTTTFQTSKISGSGSGATFVFTLSDDIMAHYKPPQYDWQSGRMPYNPETHPPYGDILRTGIYAMTCDSWTNTVHINELKSPITSENDVWDVDHRIQLTGYHGDMNPVYDDKETVHQRKAMTSWMYHLLSDQKYVATDLFDVVNNPTRYMVMDASEIQYDPERYFTYERLRNGDDFHKLISDKGLNQYGTFFSIVERDSGGYVDSTKAYLLTYKFALNLLNENKLPAYNGLNVSSFNGYTSSLIMSHQYGYPFMFDIHSRANDQYTDLGTYLTRRYADELKFSSMIHTSGSSYPNDAYKLYDSTGMNYPMYRITQIPEVINALDPYHITDVMKISDIDPDTINESMYATETEYHAGDFVYDGNSVELYYVTRDFTSSTFAEDVQSGYLVYYSRRGETAINYDRLNETTEYGGFIPIKDTYDDIVRVGGSSYENNPLYVFRIDDPSFDYDKLDGFKMYDGSLDISDQTLLIINERQYVYRNNKWEWNYRT